MWTLKSYLRSKWLPYFWDTLHQEIYLLRATWAAMTRCLSTTSKQFGHWQSRHLQNFLWPFRQETTPWFRHLAHFGVLKSLFWLWNFVTSFVDSIWHEVLKNKKIRKANILLLGIRSVHIRHEIFYPNDRKQKTKETRHLKMQSILVMLELKHYRSSCFSF